MAFSANSGSTVKKGRGKQLPQRSLTAAEEEIWQLLDRASLSREINFMMRLARLALLERIFSGQDKIDLSHSQLTILRVINACPGLTQQRIADALCIKKTNLTVLINELVAVDLVTRKSSPLNRKAYALQLTRRGERALVKAKKIVSNQLSFMEDILNPDEREQLLHSLQKIIQRLPLRGGQNKTSDMD